MLTRNYKQTCILLVIVCSISLLVSRESLRSRPAKIFQEWMQPQSRGTRNFVGSRPPPALHKAAPLEDCRFDLSMLAHDDKLLSSELFQTLRFLPPVSMTEEYGYSKEELKLFPRPLGSKLCIADVDTRELDSSRKDLKDFGPSHWGYINHYIYSRLHGYTYKQVVAPVKDELGPTWVKVKELFRMVMEDDCQFVVIMDGDTLFSDLRIPFEAMLSHWNMTANISLAAGYDYDGVHDIYGNTVLNTGVLIAQKTEIFPSLMTDWLECTTDIKYPFCSIWAKEWAHEQAAMSNFIRYDYHDTILQLDREEIHGGRFIRHYWSDHKKWIEEDSKTTLVKWIFDTLLNDYNNVHAARNADQYERFMAENGVQSNENPNSLPDSSRRPGSKNNYVPPPLSTKSLEKAKQLLEEWQSKQTDGQQKKTVPAGV